MFILAGIRRNFQIFIFLCFFFVLVLNRSELSQRRLPGGGREAIRSPKPHPHPRLGSPPVAFCVLGGDGSMSRILGGGQCPQLVMKQRGWQGDCLGKGASNVAAAQLSPSCS